jgi:ribosomal protein S18 acetylase RimI-like enzyme
VRGCLPLCMRSDDSSEILIRPMVPADRAAIADVISSVGNFNEPEKSCALELVDIYLHNSTQNDYRIVIAEDSTRPRGYTCWGPVPLTKGAYDLYWIAVHPSVQGAGFGRALLNHVEAEVRAMKGRLLIIETSSKESYGNTVGFYRRTGYEQASQIRDFYDVGDDKLTFVKRLSR